MIKLMIKCRFFPLNMNGFFYPILIATSHLLAMAVIPQSLTLQVTRTLNYMYLTLVLFFIIMQKKVCRFAKRQIAIILILVSFL